MYDKHLFLYDLKVHIESLNYILNPYVESYCVLHVHFYIYIFQNQKNQAISPNMKFNFFIQGASGYIWVCMHAYGYFGSQYRGNGVISARGGVCMHDLGLRVAGKFPGTSCRDSFCQKKSNNKKKPHRTSTQAGIDHSFKLA